MQCLLILARGRVQGVGFRPFVYRLAQKFGLKGWVKNSPEGVLIHIEGEKPSCDSFRHALLGAEKPPLVCYDRIELKPAVSEGYIDFTIHESDKSGQNSVSVPADTATCPSCLSELNNDGDRRFNHAFINCTDCGPRFSVIRDTPYDRQYTTMDKFPLCRLCAQEMVDVTSRRFHAQTNTCPKCGPQLQLVMNEKEVLRGEQAFREAEQKLTEGRILAVKGIGGFHLLCDATSEAAVARLRERKGRYSKPFAVMVPSITAAASFATISCQDQSTLTDPAAPIVIVSLHSPELLASSVTSLRSVGVLLPYNPIYHQLCRSFNALVVTSLNYQGEPTVIEDGLAMKKAGEQADALLAHDRVIYQRADDSVVTNVGDDTVFYRRARGYVPGSVTLASEYPQVMGTGGQLKNTFCFIRGNRAFCGPHLGDMGTAAALSAWEESMHRFCRLMGFTPEAVAVDLHPGYTLTQWAKKSGKLPVVEVQHHHAHFASCLAENQHSKEALGVIFDGQGYGPDGTLWGGEFFVGSTQAYERFGHVRQVPLVTGEAAIREPWRMACVVMEEVFGKDWIDLPLTISQVAVSRNWPVLSRLAPNRRLSPLTSSCGRLFDAISSIIGLCHFASYEGEAAVLLENAADEKAEPPYPFTVTGSTLLVVDWQPVIEKIVADILRGVCVSSIASRFHAAVVQMIVSMCLRGKQITGLSTVALSGGVFQNKILLKAAAAALRKEQFQVLLQRHVPSNDGGLALGQAVIAANTRKGCEVHVSGYSRTDSDGRRAKSSC